MARFPPIPEELKKNVLEQLALGRTQSDVGRQFGITQNKVAYIQRRAALNGHRPLDESEEVIVPKDIAGYRSFIAKASQAREDALDALWGWKAIEKNTSSEITQVAIDAAIGAANAWRKAAMELESRSRK